MKKNVLVTATTFPRWRNDKVPSFVYDLSLQYKKLGWNVIALAPHYPGAKFKEHLDGLEIYRFPYFYPTKFEKVAYDGGVLGNLKRSFLAKLQIPFFFLMDFLFMFYLVIKKKVDVIHSHWIISQGLVAAVISTLTRSRHVCTIHAGDISLLEKVPMRKLLANFIFNHSERIVFVSNYGLQRTLSICNSKSLKNKSSIIPMGVYINRSNKAKTKINKFKEGNIILFIGRLSEKKGIPYLLKAFAKVNIAEPSTRLVIAGDGPDLEDLKKLSHKLNISNRISFTGFVTGTQKVELLSMADTVVIPSIVTKDGDAEGLPVVIMEAMANGKSIVATNTGGISELINTGFNGLLVKEKDIDALSNAITELLLNTKLRASIGKQAKIDINSYDWRIIGKKYGNVISNLKA